MECLRFTVPLWVETEKGENNYKKLSETEKTNDKKPEKTNDK